MPHRRKPFIDKKHATKYRLIPGFVPDSDQDGPLSQQTEEQVELRKEEQRKYGIFFEDDYDYMKHLRSLREEAAMIKVSDLNDMEEELRSSYGGSMASVNFKMLSSKVQVKEDEIDPDILASLDEAPEVKMTEDGEIEFTDGIDMLEDDFISRAGGYQYKPKLEDIEESYPQFDPDEQDLGSEFDDLSDNDFEDEVTDSEDEEYNMKEMRAPEGRGTVQDDIIEGQTALILKNFEEGLGFSASAQQMDEEDCVATTEDYEHLREILIQEQIKKDKLMSASEFLDNHAERPEFDYSKFAYENNQEEEFEWKDMPPSKPKFDCVSILSLNSNTRNLPTDIIPPSSEKRRSKQSSTCETNPSVTVGLSRHELEEEMRLSRKADQASTFRPQDETPEERKTRKKAIKEGRKERRQEKKANKIVFSMEKQKMDREFAALSKSGKGMKLS